MKVLAVRFEGTISDTEWNPIKSTIDWLQLLAPDNDIVVISVDAGTSLGLQRVLSWLRENDVPYADVWSSFTLPPHDVYVDLNAVTDFEKFNAD